jgi:hypothetical protein
MIDGNMTGADSTDGDITDGDMTDGDMTDGGMTDADSTDGDTDFVSVVEAGLATEDAGADSTDALFCELQ